jgi:Tol biopolymer transport system component
MSEGRDLLDRIKRQVPPPGFEDLLARQERKQRRARVSARLTALAITVLVIGGGWFALGSLRHGTSPADGNTDGAGAARNGSISFTIRDSNQWHVATVHPDGTGFQILTDGVRDYGTSWSPDGTKIAYDTDQSGIWIMNADGSHAHQVTTGNDFSPRWSPDGSKLTFCRFGDGMVKVTQGSITASHLWTVNTDGSGEKQLTSGDVSDNVGGWSPDSSQVVFARWSADGWGLWSINADGTGARELVTLGTEIGSPSWSPDGREILYTRMSYVEGNSAPRIWLVNSDGTGDHMLLDQWAEDPTWSPDGAEIAYTSGGDIWAMNADGTNPQQLTTDPAEELQPSWGPLSR